MCVKFVIGSSLASKVFVCSEFSGFPPFHNNIHQIPIDLEFGVLFFVWIEGHCLDMPLDMPLLNFRPYVPTGAVSHDDDDDDGILFICISIVDLESCDTCNSLLRL